MHLLHVCSVTTGLSDSVQQHGPWPTRLLCPWDCPGKNIGVGCHALLQEIFLTQELKLHLLHWMVDSLPLSLLERPGELDGGSLKN